MKKLFILLSILVAGTVYVEACTNLIVGKKASKDGSVMCSYSADDYGMFIGLCHFPAGKHSKGEMRKVYDWDTNEYHGEIPEAEETYNVIGNINEYQVSIGETTFGGREEMVDTTGILDYGSLIYIALQRSKTAREAIKVMTGLVETYGYCSEGETFTICDPNEAWIMEMMGKGPGSKGVVWVALRVPDDAICAHANQSRIRTFNIKDKKNVMVSDDCIGYARRMGWFDGADKDFSFCDAYAKPDFSGRRICDARVWSFFNHFSDDMNRYIPYVEGKQADTEPLPLWIVPNRKVSLQDMEACMRDHYEGTPFSLDNDPGRGVWDMPYRPTPLTYTVDGKKYFNERPISTQQSAFSYVAQLRSWLPRQIGGILWFGNDDGNMVAFTPVYCGNTVRPECYNTKGADAVTFSNKNAFWVCNWVSNMVYPRYSLMFPSLKEVRDSLDNSYFVNQPAVEKKALSLYENSREEAVKYLNDYSNTVAQQMLDRWNELAIYLIVKYNDMAVKPEKDGKFMRTKTGLGAKVERPGYPESVARDIVRQSGCRYAVPE
ncbi:peptidase C69 [Prevotella sp. PCHR]|uniref:Dipeptidase n=1 Tax=Xylanibacter caecicola TaxID=2736294 RepID=A0ABX2B4S7_9BACT|nr:C69 family dipeptidase [Xylanibacter caecicola]NPE25099.1 peptidase C69 [Xylanibacter caecicola]